MREISLLRIVAQGLVPATAHRTPHEVVSAMLATQGQLPGSVPHSLIVRTADATGTDVRAEFEGQRLVRSWPFRGTLHITTAHDHHWLRALWTRRSNSWWQRESVRVALNEYDVDRARELTRALLSDRPRTRAELRQLWLDEGIGGAHNEADRTRTCYLIFVHFHRDGTIVSGPPGRGEHLVIDAAELPGIAHPLVSRIESGDQDAAREAYREVALRYAVTRGPITADDFARWTGAGKAVARRALDDAVDSPRTLDGAPSTPLMRVAIERTGFTAVGPDHPGGYYLRADLPDLLAENRAAAKRTHYLASFDELHAGYKDRTGLADAATEKLICPGGNGMFRPLIVDGGRVVAVNPPSLGLLWKKEPSARLARDAERAITRVATRLR